jgi:hypothetical protein
MKPKQQNLILFHEFLAIHTPNDPKLDKTQQQYLGFLS